jgi:16S rRNA (cytosine967-C5)-methyltransferase
MGQITESRVAAGNILSAVSRGRRLDLAFQKGASGLEDRDRRFLHELCYGTVRLRGRLDYLLNRHLKKGIASLSPELLNLVRLGAYQILYMDGVPSYAAISQTVDQARALAGGGGSRLVNGVLRNLDREGGHASRFPPFQDDPLAHLSTWGSHPPWLVRRWLERWAPEEVARLVDRNNRPAPVYFRPLGPSLQEAKDDLAARGLESLEAGPGLPCLRLQDGIDPAQVLQWVPGIVQDPGAALVTTYAAFTPGKTVADLCAAPGGKALAMAQDGVYVLAADRSLRRLRLLKENLSRLGGRMEMVVALAQAPPFKEVSSVLLDVPCGGTGTLRRHPDARWRLSEEILQRLVEVQREILDRASRIVPTGGSLVYSTCTLEREENQEQVEGFLDRNRDFSLQPRDGIQTEYLDEHGYLWITPQATGFDGAFAARMVREP